MNNNKDDIKKILKVELFKGAYVWAANDEEGRAYRDSVMAHAEDDVKMVIRWKENNEIACMTGINRSIIPLEIRMQVILAGLVEEAVAGGMAVKIDDLKIDFMENGYDNVFTYCVTDDDRMTDDQIKTIREAMKDLDRW